MASDAKVTVEEMDEAIRVASLIARDYGSSVSMTILDATRAHIRRANVVLGPECKCGHFLKAEHGRSYNPERNAVRTYCKVDGCDCEIWPGNQIESALLAPATGATESERREG